MTIHITKYTTLVQLIYILTGKSVKCARISKVPKKCPRCVQMSQRWRDVRIRELWDRYDEKYNIDPTSQYQCKSNMIKYSPATLDMHWVRIFQRPDVISTYS